MSADPITPQILSLAQDFDAPDESRWRALAEAALKGAPFERLVTKSPDGVTIQPLYRAPDASEPFAALVQAALAGRPTDLPWDIRQVVRSADPARANAEILDDLQGGVTSIELLVGGADGQGVRLGSAEAVAKALAGLHADIAPIALNAPRDGRQAAHLLADWLAANADPAQVRPAFNRDPITPWLSDGALGRPVEEELADAARFAAATRARFPNATGLAAGGRGAHEAGASPAQELAMMLASGVSHLRALEAVGIDPIEGAQLILFRLAGGADVVVEIAKLRAARALWARVMELSGAGPEDRAMRLQVTTARRMLSRDDAWTNILRGTAACFAAAAGGADIITVLPFTTPLGGASALARRMARNTQVILMEESRLGHVADPGGGGFAVEALTKTLAEEAWAIFQGLEVQGGLIAALRSGSFQADISKTAEARGKLIATRRFPITGVSDFPLLDETTPETDPVAATVSTTAPAADPIAPLPWTRHAEPFEALRDAAKGKDAKVFFANLGPLAEFSPRSTFAMNLFAAGGVAGVGPDTAYPDHSAMAAAFRSSGCRVAVLTGSDGRYAAESLEAAAALQAAGCAWLIHAGKPTDEQTSRATGFDQFIFAGQDAVAALRLLHTALGIA
jgi:methylmalonyl-CoA mutase